MDGFAGGVESDGGGKDGGGSRVEGEVDDRSGLGFGMGKLRCQERRVSMDMGPRMRNYYLAPRMYSV